MTLGEIIALLDFKNIPDKNCDKVNALLDEHIGHVATRIHRLRALEKERKTLPLQCLSRDAAADCGILSSLEKAPRDHKHPQAAPSHEVHIQGTHPQLGIPLPSSDMAFHN